MEMDVLTKLTLKQDATLFPFTPMPLTLNAWELEYMPAIFSEILNISIRTVTPISHVGSVMVWDVEPYKQADPRMVYCAGVDLSWYYELWARYTRRNVSMNERNYKWSLENFDAHLRALNYRMLQVDEAAFLTLELLRFKNEFIRRVAVLSPSW